MTLWQTWCPTCPPCPLRRPRRSTATACLPTGASAASSPRGVGRAQTVPTSRPRSRAPRRRLWTLTTLCTWTLSESRRRSLVRNLRCPSSSSAAIQIRRRWMTSRLTLWWPLPT
uniref:Uncharacterized protein n=1 Tax=Ixodes ricinus TaxID=34613 RepID=A0A6B0UKW9_IXORI